MLVVSPNVATTLRGELITLRNAEIADIPELAAIRAKPEVFRHWRGGDDLTAAVTEDLRHPDLETMAVEYEGVIVGAVEWSAETDPDYRHANIDIYLDPSVHGKGIGTDSVHTIARHLISEHGFHRLAIDPAADNRAAIRCYRKVGFRPVGIMRDYERGSDGTWHDNLLMDLLAEELSG